MLRARWLSVLVVSILVFAAAARAAGQDTLTIETAGGDLSFTVELALTAEERRQGLMFRKSLPADQGMLFDYGRPVNASMWMKNTYIPLDMLFIGEDGRIEKIAERTIPHSLQTISAGRPVRAVLELNGGTASRHGIKVGDRVLHPIFGDKNG